MPKCFLCLLSFRIYVVFYVFSLIASIYVDECLGVLSVFSFSIIASFDLTSSFVAYKTPFSLRASVLGASWNSYQTKFYSFLLGAASILHQFIIYIFWCLNLWNSMLIFSIFCCCLHILIFISPYLNCTLLILQILFMKWRANERRRRRFVLSNWKKSGRFVKYVNIIWVTCQIKCAINKSKHTHEFLEHSCTSVS